MWPFITGFNAIAFFVVFVVILMIASCDTNQSNKPADNNIAHHFQYVKDERTNLCFATYLLGYQGGFAVSVPCTPELEQFIFHVRGNP